MNAPLARAVAPLGDVADFINGYAFKPEDWSSEGLPIIRIQNLTGTSNELNRTKLDVPEKYLVDRGDLLVSWSASLGVFQWQGPKAIVNQHIFKVVPNLKKVNVDYLRHSIDSSIHEMERFTHGSTMKHINRKEFLEHSIPLPPLDEQRRIAAILDKTDALRRKRKRTLELFDSLTQSIFQQMFGDPVSNPKGWKQANLGDVIHRASDGPHVSPEYSLSGIPFLSTRHVQRGRFVGKT
jgi:type I restriction enzyme, S subunit